ncbi:hypothetical protein RHGRI_038917 [Rhododendron griersonianum]|uniref:Transposase-associated domain-containing protein n=1 Tax=Rhododendron griersonianum TaxID=479676 RepID=A0AAV6HKL8_9ERIC|nr:hypothetical protein RHGRI_038917 [Rhododendron griersonianum]
MAGGGCYGDDGARDGGMVVAVKRTEVAIENLTGLLGSVARNGNDRGNANGNGNVSGSGSGSWNGNGNIYQPMSYPLFNRVQFSLSGNYPYHKFCYKEHYHPKCDVCKHFNIEHILSGSRSTASFINTMGLLGAVAVSAWSQGKQNMSHWRTVESSVLSVWTMDTNQCQPLYLDIQEFYERLNMKVEQQVPLLLVERQALNEARDGEKSGHHHMPETRGLCLSEEQTVSTILRRPKIGAGNRAMNMITEPYKLIRRCEVTAILILFGLPRLWNSCMKETEVFVEHVLSIHIEANMYVQVPQLRTFRLAEIEENNFDQFFCEEEMDKSWMLLSDRFCPAYVDGVDSFIEFAKAHLSGEVEIKCPCTNCHNYYKNDYDTVRTHLLIRGMMVSYTTWLVHGELPEPDEQDDSEDEYNEDRDFEVQHDRDNVNPEIIPGDELIAAQVDDQDNEDDTMAEYMDEEDNDLSRQNDHDADSDADSDVDPDVDADVDYDI